MMLFYTFCLWNVPCIQLWRACRLPLYSLICSGNKKLKKNRKNTLIKHSVLQILHNISNPYFHCTVRRVETKACPLTLHEELCSLVTAVSRSWGAVMFILRRIFGRAHSWSLCSNIPLSQKEYLVGGKGLAVWKWVNVMKNLWTHLRDHCKVKLWVAGKLTEIRDPMTKEPDQEAAADEQDFCCAAVRKGRSL